MRLPGLVVAGLLALPALAALSPEQRQQNLDSFDYVWKTIREKHWSLPAGLDWNKTKDELRPKVETAETREQARAVIREMIGRLHQSHFNILPEDVYDSLHEAAEGQPGFDLRIIDDQVVVVCPKPRKYIRGGWFRECAEQSYAPKVQKAAAAIPDPGIRRVMAMRAALAAVGGAIGSKVKIEFLDGSNQPVVKEIEEKAPRGKPVKFGYLPEQHVWFESSQSDSIGYTRWNIFMDPTAVSSRFADSVQSCRACDGFIIDIRGNPGGIGGMAMGMAGWFISEPNKRLGVMKTRDTEVKFVILPRPETFDGPLAILVDEGSASTSEIFAGGMKDLGRARIFGTRTAGAALPVRFRTAPERRWFPVRYR